MVYFLVLLIINKKFCSCYISIIIYLMFFIKSRTGNGKISASGGNGVAGGGGGRVAIDVFSHHDDPKFFVHG